MRKQFFSNGTSSGQRFLLLSFLALLLALPASAASAPTLIFTFTGGSDGSIPQGALLLDSSGALMGVTAQGGTSGKGVAFKLTPPVNAGSWTETVLHSFSGSDGANPTVRLVADNKGSLYGIAPVGGTSNRGVVFQLKPPTNPGGTWTETVLHNFTGGSDGFGPFGVLLIGQNGALYGTTSQNNPQPGRVFRLKPPKVAGRPWAFKVLHNDLATLINVDVVDDTGTLFGTTLGPGQFFKLSQSGNEQILINQVDYPMPGLAVGPDGVLYGGSFGADVLKFIPPANQTGTWTIERLNPGFCFNNGMPTVDSAGTIYGYNVNVCNSPAHGAVYQLTP